MSTSKLDANGVKVNDKDATEPINEEQAEILKQNSQVIGFKKSNSSPKIPKTLIVQNTNYGINMTNTQSTQLSNNLSNKQTTINNNVTEKFSNNRLVSKVQQKVMQQSSSNPCSRRRNQMSSQNNLTYKKQVYKATSRDDMINCNSGQTTVRVYGISKNAQSYSPGKSLNIGIKKQRNSCKKGLKNLGTLGSIINNSNTDRHLTSDSSGLILRGTQAKRLNDVSPGFGKKTNPSNYLMVTNNGKKYVDKGYNSDRKHKGTRSTNKSINANNCLSKDNLLSFKRTITGLNLGQQSTPRGLEQYQLTSQKNLKNPKVLSKTKLIFNSERQKKYDHQNLSREKSANNSLINPKNRS